MSIAFVNSADLTNNSGSSSGLTHSYTVGSGANRLLTVAFAGDLSTANDDITSVTYAGASMTLATKNLDTGGSFRSTTRIMYLYFLLNPTSGSNGLVISSSSTKFLIACAADYTGVAQSGQPDATAVNVGSQASGAGALTVATNITVSASNSWIVAAVGGNGQNNLTSSSDLTSRITGSAFHTPTILDTNADVSSGVNTRHITQDPAGQNLDILTILASFSPIQASTVTASAVGATQRPAIWWSGSA